MAVVPLFMLLLTPAAVHAIPNVSAADWTLAVYLDSDNNLDLWAQKDLDEMMAVGSTKSVNVVVLWDKLSGPAYAYKVLKNGLGELTDCSLDGIEPDMGDPSTLRRFVTYVFKNFRAKHFALLCWDHGDDFRGCMYDVHIPEEGFDLLTHQELVAALSGLEIDVLIYGACVMSTIEVAYEYYASGLSINYYVANEGYDPMDGYPYDTILTRLVAQPTMSPLELSKTFVDEYVGYYDHASKTYTQTVTLSVVQISGVGKVVTDLHRMTEAIMGDIDGYAQIVSDARGRANLPWTENGWERLVDLPTFVNTIHDESLVPELVDDINPVAMGSVVSSSESLLASLSDAILYHRNTHAMEKAGCLGMGIYFPTSRESYEHNGKLYGSLYPEMRFAQEGWLDFLKAYWNVKAG